MTAEHWLPIPGYEDAYAISSHGRVRSYDRLVTRRDGRRRRVNGQILKPGRDRFGYEIVCLWRDNQRRGYSVRRLVSDLFTAQEAA
jgi:NUMOD4 motif